MRTESFHADDLAKALRRSKIATMPELKRALGTEVDVTVFRKLKQLAYRTSYSHRGAYYTLDEASLGIERDATTGVMRHDQTCRAHATREAPSGSPQWTLPP